MIKFDKHIRKHVKPKRRYDFVIAKFNELGIDSLEKLDDLPAHAGATITGYSSSLLVSQLREDVIMDQVKQSLNEEEE